MALKIMGINDFMRTRRKKMAINLILFAVLYFSVSFNKEYIRPILGNTSILGIITGSFSNFMSAYIISLFPFSSVLSSNFSLRKSRLVVYVVAVIVFILLTIEEIKPYAGASKVYDVYDIIASGLGSILSILTFEILVRRITAKRGQYFE